MISGVFLLLITSKPTILIVDDDVSILRVFSKIFQRKGYCVTVAERGEDAIEKLSLNRYDVALVDLVLPDMEGNQLFPVITNLSPKTVKIMLTGKTGLRDSIEGADAFIEKPINPEKLLSIIDTKLKSRDSEN
jgi:DNA-binding NtrC family response regulator